MIPEAASRAAEIAYRETLTELRLSEGGGFKVSSQVKRSIQSALEAAAPHMLAKAWDEGEQAGVENHAAEEYPEVPDITNPYRRQP